MRKASLAHLLVIDKPRNERSQAQNEPGRSRLIPRAGYDRLALMSGLSLVPISIAASEFFLSIAVVVRLVRLARSQTRMDFPRCFWFWLLWTGLEFVVWAQSPRPALGWSEIRHIILVGSLFAVLPALGRKKDCRTVWKAILITWSLSCVFLFLELFWRLSGYLYCVCAGCGVRL